jgi:hypothetical protein
MPHRRKPKKGSFGGRFDELVKHFAHEPASAEAEEAGHSKPDDPKSSVHDRLFERAWKTVGQQDDRHP